MTDPFPRKSTRLTIYLLDDETKDFADALAIGESPEPIAIQPEFDIDGIFYFDARPPHRAAWVEFIQPALAARLDRALSASSSGLLLVRVADRMFAITFGFGKGMLDFERVVRRFGLRVTLNRVAPAELRSLDTKTLEDMVVSKTTQTSRSADLPAFGVDPSRDLLRATTGRPADRNFALTLSGADALVISARVSMETLATKLAEILEAYEDTAYKTDFGWVDHLTQVTTESIKESLDDQLVADLREGNTRSVHMAPPDALPWDEIEGFAFKVGGTRGNVYDDLDLEMYLNDLGESRHYLTRELLKGRRVQVQYARTGEFDDRWSVYRCLVAEYRRDDLLYVLTEGEWFQVQATLSAQVDEFLQTVGSTPTEFPQADLGQPEAAYNLLVAPPDSPVNLLLDVKVPRPGGASSGIEPCDVLTANGEFIHVKRRARSSTLSHLFAQGSASLTALRQDNVYRERVRQAITDRAGNRDASTWLEYVPEQWPEGHAQRLRVTYAVVANSSVEGFDWLPFFSKLNFMQHAAQIRLIGATVGLVRIPAGAAAP